MRTRALLLVFVATTAILAGCGERAATPAQPDTDGAPAPAAAISPGEAGSGLAAPSTPVVPAISPERAAEIADGRQLAEQNCGGCHALDADMESPRPDAPPMRELLARYDADALASDLIEGIKLGHEDMPLFDFNVIAADSLVAYLQSIRNEQ